MGRTVEDHQNGGSRSKCIMVQGTGPFEYRNKAKITAGVKSKKGQVAGERRRGCDEGKEFINSFEE